MLLPGIGVEGDAGNVTRASTTQGSVGQGGQTGSFLSFMRSHSKVVGGSGGGSVRLSSWKLSRIREYSQASSSQAQPAGMARTGFATHSAYLIATKSGPPVAATLVSSKLGSQGFVAAPGPHLARSRKTGSATKISSPYGPKV